MELKDIFKKTCIEIKEGCYANLLFEVQLDVARKNNRNKFILCCEFYKDEFKKFFNDNLNVEKIYVYSATASNDSTLTKGTLYNFLCNVFSDDDCKIFIKIFSRTHLTISDVAFLLLKYNEFSGAFSNENKINDTRYCFSLFKEKKYFDYDLGSDICIGIINEALCHKVFNFNYDSNGVKFKCNLSDSKGIEENFSIKGKLSLSSDNEPFNILYTNIDEINQNKSNNHNSFNDIYFPTKYINNGIYRNSVFSYKYFIQILDVGQANTIVINELNANTANPFIIYDCGLPRQNANKYIHKIKSLKAPQFLVLSHYDLDHIKGLIKNANLYNCIWIVPSINQLNGKRIHLSKTAQMILNYKYKMGNLYFVDNSYEYNDYYNKSFNLPYDLSIYKGKTPTSKSPKSNNALGLVVKIKNSTGTLLLTGDVFINVIGKMNFKCNDLNILQMPHHGCKITQEEEKIIENLIGTQKNTECIISVNSKENNYGHPDINTLNFLKSVFDNVYSTEIHGDIMFKF